MDPTLLLALLGLAAAILVFAFARRRAPALVALAAAVTALSGAESVLMGAGHLFGVIARALSGRGAGDAPFAYDFRFYSLVLMGLLLIVPGLLALASVPGLTRRRLASWRIALWSNVVLLALNAPLAPIQGFAYVLGGLAAASVAALALARRHVAPPG